jgi:hypothetical protein
MVAFTRFAHAPILERGAIVQADLVVAADDTLLTELAVQPFAGCASHCTVLVNSTQADCAARAPPFHDGFLRVLTQLSTPDPAPCLDATARGACIRPGSGL